MKNKLFFNPFKKRDSGNPVNDPFTLDENMIFLLHYLRHRKIKWGIDFRVRELFENYEKTISVLKVYGYLEDDNHFEFLKEMNVADLKAVSKKFQLSTSGVKKDLIKRIIDNTTPEQRAQICSDQYYVLTAAGIKVDEEYVRNKKEQNRTMQKDFLQETKRSNYEHASLIKANTYSQMPIPPGIGIDWKNTREVRQRSRFEQTRLRNFDFSDLNNSEDYKEILLQILYYDNEIGHNLFASISKFITPENERIVCPELEKFFEGKNYIPTEAEKIFVYLDTKRFNEFQTNMRKTLKNEKYRLLPKGTFHISDQTIDFWKKQKEDREEFERLSQLEIKGFPKTLQTFQKHKEKNDEKYHSWLNANL